MGGIYSEPYNDYDSIILPLITWLSAQGVHLEMNVQVSGLDFDPGGGRTAVKCIRCSNGGNDRTITVEENDLVFITLGSMTDNSSLGSMTAPPALNVTKTGTLWALWEDIANGRPGFGCPSVFADHVDKSKWESFTVTLRGPTFFKFMEEFTGNEAGTGWLVTFIDSNWLMSIDLPRQPHFINQPETVNTFWGYGLFPDRIGDFVKKPMSQCSGEEILAELFGHLRLENVAQSIMASSTCIPCMMPFITSQFLPRLKGNRPDVVPEDAANFAFLGQFCEIPDDVVFTVEYSVRSAQMAVYTLLDLKKEVPPVYKGQYDVGVLFNALSALFK